MNNINAEFNIFGRAGELKIEYYRKWLSKLEDKCKKFSENLEEKCYYDILEIENNGGNDKIYRKNI